MNRILLNRASLLERRQLKNTLNDEKIIRKSISGLKMISTKPSSTVVPIRFYFSEHFFFQFHFAFSQPHNNVLKCGWFQKSYSNFIPFNRF